MGAENPVTSCGLRLAQFAQIIAEGSRHVQRAIPRNGCDVEIGEGAWLATNVMVAGPVKIGAHAVVGGGSVVRKDVEPYAVVAGNPARLIRYLTPPDGHR